MVTLLEAEKRYGGRTVLRLDRLELHRNDWLVITGANGSGKSTLMRVLSGVSVLSSGHVIRSKEYEASRICYVPQSGGLHANLTLADNLRMWLRLFSQIEPDALSSQWYIDRFDLTRHLKTRCGDLSGGFQRLAALACALATCPHGLLIDEPLSGIDRTHADALLDGLAAARNDLLFLVVTSHSANEFAAANRFVDLTRGPAA